MIPNPDNFAQERDRIIRYFLTAGEAEFTAQQAADRLIEAQGYAYVAAPRLPTAEDLANEPGMRHDDAGDQRFVMHAYRNFWSLRQFQMRNIHRMEMRLERIQKRLALAGVSQ